MSKHREPKYVCLFCTPFPRTRPPRVKRFGIFVRVSDRRRVKRYRCLDCKRTFSDATSTFEYRQRKRNINQYLFELLVSKVSMRRAAKLTKVHRTTVDHRLAYFAKVSDSYRQAYLSELSGLERIQFDDMESSEHTKLKPLSIPMVVEEKTRKILSFDVVSMPAKGPLAEISRKKYGKRLDDRRKGWREVLTKVEPVLSCHPTITSDSHTMYPQMIKRYLPRATHIREKGRKACIAGQGELKVGGFDPLFSFNQTAAMLRDNLSRLIRRTWCNTKKAERLKMHISIYSYWHNQHIDAQKFRCQPHFHFS